MDTSCIVHRNKLATCTHVKVTAKGRPSGTATTTIVTCVALYLVEKNYYKKLKKKKKTI
jgi:hypothetical protein